MDSTRDKHWHPVKLEDICAQITDGKHGDCQDQADSGFYFLSCKDVANGKMNYEAAAYKTRPLGCVDYEQWYDREDGDCAR
jgi:hypothetical protein